MRKITFLFLILSLCSRLFGQGLTIYQPVPVAAGQFFNWDDSLSIQAGAEILFEGSIDNYTDVDSMGVVLSYYNPGWQGEAYPRNSFINPVTLTSENYSFTHTIHDTMPPSNPGDIWIFQTQVYYNDLSEEWGSSTWSCIPPYHDSITLFDYTNGQHIGEFEPGETIELNGYGGYGILNNLQYIEYNLLHLDASWSTTIHTEKSFPHNITDGDPNSGFFKAGDFTVPTDWTIDSELSDGEFSIFRVGAMYEDFSWSFFWLDFDIVDIAKDSIVLTADKTEIVEWSEDNPSYNVITLDVTTYPSEASIQEYAFSSSDTNIATVSNEGIVYFKEQPVGFNTYYVDITAESLNTHHSSTITLSMTNAFTTCPGCDREISIETPFENLGIDFEPYGGGILQQGARIHCSGTIRDPEEADYFQCQFLYLENGTDITQLIHAFPGSTNLIDNQYSFNITVPEHLTPRNASSRHYLVQRIHYNDGTSSSDTVLIQVIPAQEDSIFMLDSNLQNGHYLGEYYREETIVTDMAYYGIQNTRAISQQFVVTDRDGYIMFSSQWEDIKDTFSELNDGLLPTGSYTIAADAPYLTNELAENGYTHALRFWLYSTTSDNPTHATAFFDFNIAVVETKTDSIQAWFGDNTENQSSTIELTGLYETVITDTIRVAAYPAGAVQHFTYTSANNAIARVNTDGIITPKRVGATQIIASSTTSGLSDTVTVVVTDDIIFSLEDNPNQAISIFPNPASTKLHITGMEHGRAEIYSISGMLIKNVEFQSNTLPLEQLAQGNYILRLISDDQNAIQRISIQR